MKVLILKDFRDKHTKKVYKKGEEHDFTEERVKEICEKNNKLIKVIEATEAPETQEQEVPNTEELETQEQENKAPKKSKKKED